MYRIISLFALLPSLAFAVIKDIDGNPVGSSTKFGDVDGDTGTVGEFIAIGTTGLVGRVASVNGKTGAVVLGAQDVGALPQAWTNGQTISIGEGSVARTRENIAIGHNAKTTIGENIAIGGNSSAYNNMAIAIGSYARATSANSVAIGPGAQDHGQGTITLSTPDFTGPSMFYLGETPITDFMFPKSGGQIYGNVVISKEGFLKTGSLDVGYSFGSIMIATNGIGYLSVGKENKGTLFVGGTNVLNEINSKLSTTGGTVTGDVTFQNGVQIEDEDGHNVLKSVASKNYLGATNDILRIEGKDVIIDSDRKLEIQSTNIVVKSGLEDIAFNGTNLASQVGAIATNVVNSFPTTYALTNAVVALNQSVQYAAVADGGTLTILAPTTNEAHDWVVYALAASDNNTLKLPAGNYYATDEAYTNKLSAGMTVLYFSSTPTGGYILGRQELKPITVNQE